MHRSKHVAHASNRNLPPPDSIEERHSDLVSDQIREQMKLSGGTLDFSSFMDIALYQPELGYYMSDLRKFGEGGDFVTAPELGGLFGRCIARQCHQVLQAIGGGDILEVGAGSGALAAQVLTTLEKEYALPRTYQILELSDSLRAHQRQTLTLQVPHLIDRVQWMEQQPQPSFRGVMLANELLDALPTTRFYVDQGCLSVFHVAHEHGQFTWRTVAANEAVTRSIQERLDTSALPNGYSSEINLQAESWVRTLGQALDTGVMLIVDYGFPRHEFYHPQRHQGTLMCHYRHRAHDDPLILVGLQDITAHLDFTALAQSGHDAGLELYGYTQQAPFLMSLGLLDLIADTSLIPKLGLQLTQQVKKLTLPSEMGELYKVIALGRGVNQGLIGFEMQDHRARL
ncbi:MAG: SAM-dependent methyltransferase [Gammaproteobacteria bacterium]|nr:SAM-dependent methyltransferase [Gammaproteobacteria bacterium]